MTLPYELLNRSATTPESFSEAYTKGFRLTIRFLLSKGADFDTAEELAQTAWVRGWEALGQLQIEERILPWVNSIAYHRFCNDRRRAIRETAFVDINAATSPTPNAALDAGTLLGLCSPNDRTMLKQRYLEGMGMKEIASRHGLTEIAVRVRIHRCQCSLRSLIGLPPNRGLAKQPASRAPGISMELGIPEPCAA